MDIERLIEFAKELDALCKKYDCCAWFASVHRVCSLENFIETTPHLFRMGNFKVSASPDVYRENIWTISVHDIPYLPDNLEPLFVEKIIEQVF